MKNGTRLSASDYGEIYNLYAYYNHSSDAGDAEGYAACFTDDGVLHLETRDLIVKGRSDLAEFKHQDAARRGSTYRRHWNGSVHLEKLDRNTVRGRCYLQAFNGEPGSLPVLSGSGVYEDTIVKVPGGWKFAKRRLRMDAGLGLQPSEARSGAPS